MTTTPPAPLTEDVLALDLSVLEKMVGNDPVKFKKFALLFISSLEDVLQQIDEAMTRIDLAALSAMGHRAKSTALNIGATGFSGQCRLLEQAAGAGDSARAMALAQSLRPLFLGIRDAIEDRLAS